MGWLDRFLSFIGFEVEVAEDETAATTERAEPDAEPRPRKRRERGGPPGSVVALPGKSSDMHVILLRPRDFEDVQVVADHLKSRRPVIVNLEGVERELAQRVINFLSGTIYALNGEMHSVSTNVLFFAPGGVEVSVAGSPPAREPGSGSWRSKE